MSWIMVGTAAIGAIQGAQQAKAQRKANQQNADMAAAQTEFSPWTGAKPGQAEMGAITTSALEGGVQGAMTGAMNKGRMGFGQGTSANPNNMDKAIEGGLAYGPAKPKNFSY